MKDAEAPTRGEIPSLDGLRAVSIFIVFAGHSGLSPVGGAGFGVTVFFFLSGFLITTLMVREWERTGRLALGAFYARRAIRLLPPLLITLALGYGLVAAGLAEGRLDWGALVSQALFVYNYYYLYVEGATQGVLGFHILWSLSVEEHFYLAFPVLFLAIAKGKVGLRGVALLLALVLAWRTLRVLAFDTPVNFTYFSTDTRLDSILWGAFLALLDWRGVSERIFPKAGGGRAGLIAGAGCVILLCFLYRDPVFRETLRYTLQGAALLVVFRYAVTAPDAWIFRPLNWGWVKTVGVWSYTLYLVHTLALSLVHSHAVPYQEKALYIPLSAALALAYAAAMHALVERPLARWRVRLRR